MSECQKFSKHDFPLIKLTGSLSYNSFFPLHFYCMTLFWNKNTNFGTGEVDQLVRIVVCKHKDLSSNPWHTRKWPCTATFPHEPYLSISLYIQHHKDIAVLYCSYLLFQLRIQAFTSIALAHHISLQFLLCNLPKYEYWETEAEVPAWPVQLQLF